MTGHGYVQYRRGCRCFTCRIGKHNYYKRLEAGENAGLSSAAAAREHLRQLRAAGFGLRRLSAATGIARATLWRLATFDKDEVFSTTAERLLAFQPVELTKPRRFTPAVGTHRRVQALCTLGWSPARQIVLAGLSENGSTRLLAVEQVWPRTAAKVAALYERLSMTPAPPSRFATKARNRALREAFFPPLAWDEHTIDDPEALPCLLPPLEPVARDLELAVQHVVAGHVDQPERAVVAEIVRRMPDRKPREIAAVARCTPAIVSAVREQARRVSC